MSLETIEPAGSVPAADASTAPTPIRVIFICTGNAARSQMAEALLRHAGEGRFDVVSAGVTPRPVHPMTITALAKVGIDITGATSKPVGGFIGRRFDYVITVCDRARALCPVFPGGTQTLHWGIDDPAEAAGTDRERQAAYDRALRELAGRIHALIPMALAAAR